MIKGFTCVSVVTLSALFFASPAISQQADQKQPPQKAKQPPPPPLPGTGTGGNSAHATISSPIGQNRNVGSMITITYGRPTAKHPRTGEQRKVWGTLVPWNQAWRLGSDEATTLINPHPLVIGSTTIPAGAHTLYLVPSDNEATTPTKLAFSKNIGKWGIPVDEKNDIARVDMKKETLDTPVEQLTLEIQNTSAGGGDLTGVLKVKWETTQYSLPFTVKK
jgi:hypothetical protein